MRTTPRHSLDPVCSARPFYPAYIYLVLFFHLASQPLILAQTTQTRVETSDNIVMCRVLETHTSTNPAVTVVVFHQRDKQDQERLGALLRQNDGEDIEVQVGNAAWQKAAVARLRSCFGRGLLILPGNTVAPKDGETFTIKFSLSKGAH